MYKDRIGWYLFILERNENYFEKENKFFTIIDALIIYKYCAINLCVIIIILKEFTINHYYSLYLSYTPTDPLTLPTLRPRSRSKKDPNSGPLKLHGGARKKTVIFTFLYNTPVTGISTLDFLTEPIWWPTYLVIIYTDRPCPHYGSGQCPNWP